MPSDLFLVRLNFVIFATDIPNNKKYILSTDSKNIEFPYIELYPKDLESLNTKIIAYAKQCVFVSDFELIPQLISLHSNSIDTDINNTLNVIYGFVISHTNSINDNLYWINFDYLNPTKHSNTIFEVIQKLK